MSAKAIKIGAMEWLRAFAGGESALWDGKKNVPGGGLASVIVQLVNRLEESNEWLTSKPWPRKKELLPLTASDAKGMSRANREAVASLRAFVHSVLWMMEHSKDVNPDWFDLVTEVAAQGLIAGRELGRGDSLPWMPFVRRGMAVRQGQKRRQKVRASFFSDSVHPTIRDEFQKRRKANPREERSQILKEMEATGKYTKLRQLQNICRGLK